MINLAWDTRGRLSRRSYRAARTRIGLTATLGLILGAVLAFSFTRHHTYASMAVAGVVIAVVSYLQYRDAQLSIKRLHDRNLPGYLMWPIMLFTAFAIGSTSLILMTALYRGGLSDFVFNLLGIMQPLVGLAFRYGGFGLMAAFALVVYNMFIGHNLNAESKPGPNLYGEDVG